MRSLREAWQWEKLHLSKIPCQTNVYPKQFKPFINIAARVKVGIMWRLGETLSDSDFVGIWCPLNGNYNSAEIGGLGYYDITYIPFLLICWWNMSKHEGERIKTPFEPIYYGFIATVSVTAKWFLSRQERPCFERYLVQGRTWQMIKTSIAIHWLQWRSLLVSSS